MRDWPSVVDDPGKPLVTKLGIAEGSTVALLDLPADLRLALPASVAVKRTARGDADVVLAFFTERAHLDRRLERLGSMIFPSGSLWIAWPKKSSGVATDLTDDAVREIALARGLVDNKVCAVDGTWSALRVVWRRERRGSER